MESKIKHLEIRLSGVAEQVYTMLFGKSQLRGMTMKDSFALYLNTIAFLVLNIPTFLPLAYASETTNQVNITPDGLNSKPGITFIEGIDYKHEDDLDYSQISKVDTTMTAPFADNEKHVLTMALLGQHARRAYDIIAVDNRRVIGEAAGFVVADNKAFCSMSLIFWKIVSKDGRILKALPINTKYEGDEVDFGVLKADHWPLSVEVAIYKHNDKIVGVTFSNRGGIYSCNFSTALFHPFQANIMNNKFLQYTREISIGPKRIKGLFGVSPARDAKGEWRHPKYALAEYIQVIGESIKISYDSTDEKVSNELSILFGSSE